MHVMYPCYNDALKTLYFTGTYQFTCYDAFPRDTNGSFDTTKPPVGRDVIRCYIWQSKLVGTVFQTPTPVTGAIDPTDASHWSDETEKAKDVDGNPVNFDYWIARMYVTADGTKAYFSLLSSPYGDINCYYWLLTPRVTINPSDSYHVIFGGDPNYDPTDLPAAGFGGSGVFTWVYEATVDQGTATINSPVLVSAANQPGLNFVTDISPDGQTLYVANMATTTNPDTGQPGWMPSGGWADGYTLGTIMSGWLESQPGWDGHINTITP
jgi:hypothetical protein